MDTRLVVIIGLAFSIINFSVGLLLYRYRYRVSNWAIGMLKVHNSFLLRKGNTTEITIISVLFLLYGLGCTVAFVFYCLVF